LDTSRGQFYQSGALMASGEKKQISHYVRDDIGGRGARVSLAYIGGLNYAAW